MNDAPKWPPQPDRDAGNWYTDERSISSVLISELQRLKRRMKAHPVRVLLLASLLTFGVVKKVATKPRMYTAQVVLRVSEGQLNDEKGSPLPTYGVETDIYTRVLNKHTLLDNVILKYKLHQKELEDFGEDAAIEEFRDGLDIHAFRNYFVNDRRYESTPRSLGLTISYKHQDPEYAYKIASLLSDLVVENESAKRLREARFAAQNARDTYAKAVAQVAAREIRMNVLALEYERAKLTGDRETAGRAKVEIDQLTEKLAGDDLWLLTLRRDVQKIEFRLQIEERSMALLWELASERRPRALPPPGPIRLTAVAIICFCIFVPVCAIGFGTFDSRIHESEDVHRLGMPVVGHIHGFEGDHVGSLASRGALRNRSFWDRIGFIKNRRLRDNRVA